MEIGANSMITKKPIPDGVLLRVKPFSEPNRNAGCELLARVTSSQGTRRDVQVFIGNLNNVMALTDVTILMTALRALTDEVEKQMDVVQEKAAKRKKKGKK